jgi:hypothetical protein
MDNNLVTTDVICDGTIKVGNGNDTVIGGYTCIGGSGSNSSSSVWDKLGIMLDCMNKIAEIYSLIDVHADDIFVTLKSTGKIYSVNKLIADVEKTTQARGDNQ